MTSTVVLAAVCSLPDKHESSTERAIETTLKLAAESVERGGGESTVQYLEAARSRAREDVDHDVEILVADEAVHLGERLAERGDIHNAWRCWEIALAVFGDLGDRQREENLIEVTGRWGVALNPANPEHRY